MKFELKYQSRPGLEDLVLDDIKARLIPENLPEALWRHFLLAVSEAFTNALVHGNQLNPDKLITIIVEVNETAIQADIIDEGQGGLKRIRSRKTADLLAEGGRGIMLIEHFADSVEFTETQFGGLQLTIRFDFELDKKTEQPK